jgi:hypothetical protein
MAQSTDCHDDLGGLFDVFLSRDAVNSVRRRPNRRSKLERLADAEMGEMLIDLE